MEKAKSMASAREQFQTFAPAYVKYSEDVLFGDLWKRTDLLPRDRSLLTVAALIANGNFNQLPFHLKLGLENGLSKCELIEAITHVCFYAGWPKADSALTIAKEVFEDEKI